MNFLKKIAPFLSTALSLGGPVGAIAGKALIAALGTKPDAKPDDIAAAIAGATPEQIAAIQKAEQDFQVQMKQLDIQSVDDLEKMANDDRANARQMHAQVPKDFTPEILAGAITFGFFATLWVVFVRGVNNQAHDLAMVMVGLLGSAFGAVVAFYFGSSKGQEAQTKTLSDIAKS